MTPSTRWADGLFWNLFQENPPHARVVDLLYEIGFYGVYRCGRLTYDGHLITALVQRRRPETYTFHFRVGEATITLQDIAKILALPIDGEPVCGQDINRTHDECSDYCMEYLGFEPDGTDLKVVAIILVPL
ncbi:UNVERIFIED_CONTAM: Serine/threonine-protein phosphatase 7 long form [Sesamum radiatum]|uniref:Serine/threonine-protein phosphatase 7 long form n=1 Tax=Sesamum radiatum TaxID=300843 RepID=A0AAW2LKQ0_SESRA